MTAGPSEEDRAGGGEDRPRVFGAILAGGEARRMGGGQKALRELSGLPLVEHVRRALAPVVDEIFIVARDPAPLAGLGLRVIRDTEEARCPLSGIHAALAGVEAPGVEPGKLASLLDPVVFITACDMPLLSPVFVKAILDRMSPDLDTVVPERDGWYLYPLAAAYSPRCLPAIETMLRTGERQAIRLFQHVRTRRAPIEQLAPPEVVETSLGNINTIGELREVEGMSRGYFPS